MNDWDFTDDDSEEYIPIVDEKITPYGHNPLISLHAHQTPINGILWSPNGRYLCTVSSADSTLIVWDAHDWTELARLTSEEVTCITWLSNRYVVLAGFDWQIGYSFVGIWDWYENLPRGRFAVDYSQSAIVNTVAVSKKRKLLFTAASDGVITQWDIHKKQANIYYEEHTEGINALALSFDDKYLISASSDENIGIWDIHEQQLFTLLEGHDGEVFDVAVNPRTGILASASADHTVQIWDFNKSQRLRILESHTGPVVALSFSSDGRLLASKSKDQTIRLWDCSTWEPISLLYETVSTQKFSSVAFHPKDTMIATLGDSDTVVRIWNLNYEQLLEESNIPTTVQYMTAKIALVGDSGVGKTGLGWRIAHGTFREHPSTHGQQFWVVDELTSKRDDNTECEVILWDLAGQQDYRLIHSLFLDDIDLALILFDSSHHDMWRGVGYWLKRLVNRDGSICNSILVGARADRGLPPFTQDEIELYCQEKRVSGGYISTSALTGAGMPELITKIKEQIPWGNMAATVTTETFKKIKEYILNLKEDTSNNFVLLNPNQLRSNLEEILGATNFTDAEMMTAIKHLQNHGYATILRSLSEEVSVLLFPDLLINLASSFVLEARKHPKGLGALEEDRILNAEYVMPETIGLSDNDRAILLSAVTALFLKNNICFRESLPHSTLLVFPSLISEKRPLIEQMILVDDVSYTVTGAVENVYASLVVQLGYTNLFTRINTWHNQARYQLGDSEICGFRQIEEREGEIELVIYYATETPMYARNIFQGLLEKFLSRRPAITITKYMPMICFSCGYKQQRHVVVDRLRQGFNFLFCSNCGQKNQLPESQKIDLEDEEQRKVDTGQTRAETKTVYETALVYIKGYVNQRVDYTKPSCFISYAWGDVLHERWVNDLAKDLRNAGINVILDKWHNPPGASITKFIEQIEAADFVLPIGTPKYLTKYNSEDSDPVVDAEVRLINTRLRKRTVERERVIPILLSGNADESFPPLFHDSVFIDFRIDNKYHVSLFDLVLTLHRIPRDDSHVIDLRDAVNNGTLKSSITI